MQHGEQQLDKIKSKIISQQQSQPPIPVLPPHPQPQSKRRRSKQLQLLFPPKPLPPHPPKKFIYVPPIKFSRFEIKDVIQKFIFCIP